MPQSDWILLLGAGLMQVPAIQAAKELGLKVLAIDGDDTAVGRPLADEFAHVSLKHGSQILALAQQFSQDHHVVGVFTAGTDFSATVAMVADALNLPGHHVAAAQAANNKAKMRECFAKHGIPSPRYYICDDVTTDVATIWHHLHATAETQLVVKPVDNMGARGVQMVQGAIQLQHAMQDAMAYSPSGQIVIEEYMDGPEFSTEALVYDGHIHHYGFADRHIIMPPYFIETGHTMPSQASPQVQDQVWQVFDDAVRALGLHHGAAKGDMKMTAKGPMVIEIAARLSGGYMSGWTYPYASDGINITKQAILLAIGQPVQQASSDIYPLCCAERAYMSIPGKIIAIQQLALPQDEACIRQHFARVKVGDSVALPQNNVGKCGNILAVAASPAQAIAAAEQAGRDIFLQLEPGNALTEQFLFHQTWPSCAWVYPDGSDYNRLTHQHIELGYARFTSSSINQVPASHRTRFDQALQRGGLQGAVWYYQTYLEGHV